MDAYEYGDGQIAIDGVYVKHETDAALLVVIEGEEYWIPQGQIKEDSEVFTARPEGNEGTLIISEWIAKQKGFVEE